MRLIDDDELEPRRIELFEPIDIVERLVRRNGPAPVSVSTTIPTP